MELVKEKGMSVSKPHLKLAPHVRAQLFAAIAAVREAEERLAANKTRIEALYEKTWAAQTAVEAAEAAIEKAKEAQLEYLATDSPEPAITVRQARQSHAEAEELLEDIRAARKLGEDQQQVLESDLSFAQGRLTDRIADVVRSDQSVQRFCEKFMSQSRALADMRLALDFLRLKQALPAEFRLILCERDWPDLPGDRPWRAAFADLERNADACLPD